MQDSVLEQIRRIKTLKNIEDYGEDDTKQYIILPILQSLGWDIANKDEVYREYPVDNTKVDYSLIINNTGKYFIEVKRIREELSNHEQQLIKYCSKYGVQLAALTNGITWWFYLPLTEGSWKGKKFFTIDFPSMDTNEAADNIRNLLSKDTVSSGEAVKVAKELYQSHKKKQILQENIPKAWNDLIADCDEIIIDLIIETVEKNCGHRPNEESIKQFLKKHASQLLIDIKKTAPIIHKTKTSKPRRKTQAESKPIQLILNDKSYPLRSPSVEILLFTAEWLIEHNYLKKSDSPIKSGSKRYIINKTAIHPTGKGFYSSKELSNGLCIECHNSISQAIAYAKKLLLYFNLPPNILKLQYR